jgi:glycosyltransferase involved in cell wall biosynthesis
MSSRPIRVLELRSVRGTGGGPEKTILLGTRRTDPQQFAVTVCYIRDASDRGFGITARADELGIDYVELLERGSFDPAVWPALRRVARERSIDIVHSHDYKTELLALLLQKAEGTIPLGTAHGWTGHSRRERWLYYPLDKQMLRRFPVTIAVSGHIRSELIRAGALPHRVRVVLNGIDHREFRRDRSREAEVRRELGAGTSDIIVGAAGRLEPQKRFDLLIEACALLRRRWPTLRLAIAGDGNLRKPLQELAVKLLPPEACQFLGQRHDVARLHHGFDVFAQSSDYEGTPNSVLEAMALETPIVATTAGGTAEIARDRIDALLVPAGDAVALARAIEETLSNRTATAARAARARNAVETRLSFERRMAAVERIYVELAGARAHETSGGVPRCA